MNNKRSGFRGFGVYLILVLAVIAIWYWLDGNNVTNTYTRQQFETALAEGKVTQVNVVPNREVPTGSVNITFSDSSTQVMLVSDVAEIEQYMREAGFKTYTVQNPPEDNSCPICRTRYNPIPVDFFWLFSPVNPFSKR